VAHPQRDPYPNCDVCGRTILKGEQTHEYVTPQGQRLAVCVLCRSRAEASGWIPADQAGTAIQAPPSRARPGDALRKRLGRAAARARAGARPRGGDSPPKADAARPQKAESPKRPQRRARPQGSAAAGRGEPGAQQPTKRPRPQSKRQPKRKPKREPSQQPAGEAAPRKPKPRRGPEALMRRGVQRFNGSGETRKVAGLIRSLGEPQAAVRADAGRQLALVTVAWELSWYQWEVRADGDGEPVREVAKGDEVSELAKDQRTWNAAVAEDGKLRLKAASARRKPSAKSA
jgi:hypothetical protein